MEHIAITIIIFSIFVLLAMMTTQTSIADLYAVHVKDKMNIIGFSVLISASAAFCYILYSVLYMAI